MVITSASISALVRSRHSLSLGLRKAVLRPGLMLWALASSIAIPSAFAPASAQAPIALPYTITTVAGGGASSTGTASAPVACAAGSPYKSFDSLGDGCPGPQVNFSTDLRGGIASDGQGNIYIADTSNSEIRRYDPKTGIVSRVAGKGTACTLANGLLDSSGDGCPSLQTAFAANPRGISVDPYGNVLVAGYGTQMIHVICTNASPLCPNTTGRKQVGSMYRVAGCVGTVGGGATGSPTGNTVLNTWAGTEGDNSFASPYSNLAGDASAGVTGTAAGGSCPSTNTNSSVGSINQPRGVAADKYGNVYIAETATTGAGLRFRMVLGPQTSSFFTGINPLWAIINSATSFTSTAGTFTYTAHEGYIYTILGGFTGAPTARGGACGTYAAEDAKGDGCPFFNTLANGAVQGVAVDNTGNVYFSDTPDSLVRVLYVGGSNNPISTAIIVNSGSGAGSVTTPVAGNVYLLAGGGSTTLPTATTPSLPVLGSNALLSNGYQRLAIGPAGNLYFGDTAANSVEFFDISTGYIRQLFKSGTACAAHVVGSGNGDGCPVNSFSVSGANAFGVAVDPLGNLYLADSANSLIRKVEAVSLVPTLVGSQTAAGAPYTQTLQFHGPVNTTSIRVFALNAAGDIVVGSVACSTPNADLTDDCTVPVTFTPTQPGPRTLNLSVSALDAGSNVLGSAVVPVSAIATGTALVADVASPTTNTFASGVTPVGSAIDGAGNLFFVDTASGSLIRSNIAAAVSGSIGSAPANPLQVAVDTVGNIYITSSGASSITKYTLGSSGGFTATAISNPGITLPQGIATDASNNLYVADKTSGNVFEIAAGTAFDSVQPLTTVATGLINPVGLSFDGLGNLLIADNGAGVYRVSNVNGVYTQTLYAAGSGSPAVTIAGLTPAAVAGDAAGDVYVQDSTSKSVINIPVSRAGPASTTVVAGLNTPSGLAVDGNGVIYSADSAAGKITQVLRNAAVLAFGTSTSTTLGATYENAGNIGATGYQVAGQDSAEFPITSLSPGNCFATSAITPGYACSVTSQFTPTSGTGAVSSTLGYTLASATTGTLKLTGTKTGAAVTTTTAIGTQTPTNPIYSASGVEVTFPVTVTASDSSSPTGFVNLTVDALAPVAYTLSGGAVSVPVSGLSAGSHTITAAYPSQNGVTGSTSSTAGFTIAQAATTSTFSPGASSQPFSQAIGTSVLNATAVVTGTSTAVPGYYLYTATPSGGSASSINPGSFLAVGTYTLGVTFQPIDTVNFIGSSATSSGYTVTKASTTAAVGATQSLVAADGTGNYTSVQAAVNAIPATGGGTVYIKPGTYTGFVTIVQPNVALRGLGGDPTKVVIQNEAGAFGSTYPYTGEFNASNSNGAQLQTGSTVFTGDPGSSTLVVAAGKNTAVSSATLTPLNFYAENFSLLNNYDYDKTTTTTTYASSSNGTCVAGQSTARTYNDLFNTGQLCASQALTMWMLSDLSVINNVYANSLQDTVYTAQMGGNVPARQYWFRGKITGTVDYIFGDAAAAFDYTSIYTVPHGTGNSGTATIEAQNKSVQTGSSNDYLSGYVMNSNVFTSQTAGMTGLQFGRPYGVYSTWLMLNSYVDQVNPGGYIEFSNSTSSLPTSTYAEYNDIPYTDPATGSPDLNGVTYLGVGGSSGQGVSGPRETVSQDPGTPMAANAVKTSLTAGQATLYYPRTFLGATVSNSATGVTNWNANAALGAYANTFVPSNPPSSIAAGSSVTLLMRPQTPGLGAVTNGVYTIPTGTYTLSDTINGATVTIASGSLDAAGQAYFTSSSLSGGAHNFTFNYSGDANFSGSSTASAYTLNVSGTSSSTTTTLSAPSSPVSYGTPAALSATVASGSGTPTGTVTLYADGSPVQTSTLSSGTASFSVSNLNAGTHTFSATYSGAPTFSPSSTSASQPQTITTASLTVTAACANRVFNTSDACTANVSGYKYSDSAATVFNTPPAATTSATRDSVAGTYAATPIANSLTPTAFGQTNYTVTSSGSNYTITGGAPQIILFFPLPNFTHGGTYQLAARTSSGLPVTYTITAGNSIASVSGSTLTVTGTGTIVTVQASQTSDPTGDYAPAAPVSMSFTPQ